MFQDALSETLWSLCQPTNGGRNGIVIVLEFCMPVPQKPRNNRCATTLETSQRDPLFKSTAESGTEVMRRNA